MGDKVNGTKIEFIDVRRAYFHAEAIRDVYVEAAPERAKVGMWGRLNKALYGTRDAAQNWAYSYMSFMKPIGFVTGKSSPCVFWHADEEIRVVVHGDVSASNHTSRSPSCAT